MDKKFFEKNAEEDFLSRKWKYQHDTKKYDDNQYLNSLEGDLDYQFDQIFRRSHQNNEFD